MEDIAKLANRIIVMDAGQIVMDGTPKDIFDKEKELEGIGLGVPQITEFMKRLQEKYPELPDEILTVEEAFKVLDNFMGGRADV